MSAWPKDPVLFEIDTWPWLTDVARDLGRPVTLADIPAAVWDAVLPPGVDAVWLMGVWERSPAATAVAREQWTDRMRAALPDLTDADVVGSPYAVRRYAVDERLGGATGLKAARQDLAARGLRLVLDYVPNHVAPDHPWVTDHPDYFVRGTADDLAADPSTFVETDGVVVARGRDPFFPAWPDTVQINAFDPGLRAATVATLRSIADQCDGVRCDMGMLLLDEVFAQTWGARAGSPLARPFWVEVIGELRASDPDFWFVAEAYWGREPDLLAQGFDACYDKAAYDHLVARDPGALRASISADPAAQQRTLRFTENHDEPRAAATFGPGAVRVAALVVALLPGGLLVHEGQLDGRRVQLPVPLGRRPLEAADPDLRRFHHEVLRLRRLVDRDRAGFHACEITGWPDNPSTGSLLAWEWTQADRRQLVVVNLGAGFAQGLVHLAPPPEVPILLADRLAGMVYRRRAEDVAEGLYVELPPWGAHVFEVVGEPDA